MGVDVGVQRGKGQRPHAVQRGAGKDWRGWDMAWRHSTLDAPRPCQGDACRGEASQMTEFREKAQSQVPAGQWRGWGRLPGPPAPAPSVGLAVSAGPGSWEWQGVLRAGRPETAGEGRLQPQTKCPRPEGLGPGLVGAFWMVSGGAGRFHASVSNWLTGQRSCPGDPVPLSPSVARSGDRVAGRAWLGPPGRGRAEKSPLPACTAPVPTRAHRLRPRPLSLGIFSLFRLSWLEKTPPTPPSCFP